VVVVVVVVVAVVLVLVLVLVVAVVLVLVLVVVVNDAEELGVTHAHARTYLEILGAPLHGKRVRVDVIGAPRPWAGATGPVADVCVQAQCQVARRQVVADGPHAVRKLVAVDLSEPCWSPMAAHTTTGGRRLLQFDAYALSTLRSITEDQQAPRDAPLYVQGNTTYSPAAFPARLARG
jgi:hypothetical protein